MQKQYPFKIAISDAFLRSIVLRSLLNAVLAMVGVITPEPERYMPLEAGVFGEGS